MSQTAGRRGADALPVSPGEAAALFDAAQILQAGRAGRFGRGRQHLPHASRGPLARGQRRRRHAAVEIATVDHGLRAESADEARWVGEQAKLLGLPHSILVWMGEKPVAGIQDAARERAMRCSARMRAATFPPPS